tara:strand:+ start:13517 stop:13792 length:276 start_codon:yes stop_codon:yes gene_type:complete
MKITKERLKQLINEELGSMVKEGELDEGAFDWFSKQSNPNWAAKQVADIEAGEKSGKVEQGLDKLLDDFKTGLMALLKPQMAEATEPEAGE